MPRGARLGAYRAEGLGRRCCEGMLEFREDVTMVDDGFGCGFGSGLGEGVGEGE